MTQTSVTSERFSRESFSRESAAQEKRAILSEAEIASLEEAVKEASTPRDVPRAVLTRALERFPGRLAVISSFGAESAVLLAELAKIDPGAPVYFLDTGLHFPETLAYRDALAQALGLRDVRTLHPAPAQLEARDPQNQLSAFDPDACCALRKVEPLARVQPDFSLWVTGRKRMQAATRAALPVVERVEDGGVKLNPLAGWSAAMIAEAMKESGLPPHPLVARGFRSIGCAPCTRAVGEGEDARAGRWAGLNKTECGLHRPVPAA